MGAKSGALEQISQRRRGIASAGSLVAGLALPVAAGIVEANNKDNAFGGRLTSNVLNYAGFGASVGGLLGPEGLVAGAVIGGGLGAVSTIADKSNVDKQQNVAKKLKKAQDKTDQVSIGQQIVQANARIKDLTNSGASSYAIQSSIDQVTELKSKLTNKDISKIFEPRKDESADDEQERTLAELAREVAEADRQKKYQETSLTTKSLSDKITKEKLRYELSSGNVNSSSIVGGLSPISSNNQKYSPFKLSTDLVNEKKEVLDERAASASANIKFGLGKDILTRAEGGKNVNEIFDSLRSGVGSDKEAISKFEDKKEKLLKKYLNDIEDEGLKAELLVKILERENTTEEEIAKSKAKISEDLRKTVNLEKVRFNISQQIADKELNLFK